MPLDQIYCLSSEHSLLLVGLGAFLLLACDLSTPDLQKTNKQTHNKTNKQQNKQKHTQTTKKQNLRPGGHSLMKI